jgi:hypothetical protein
MATWSGSSLWHAERRKVEEHLKQLGVNKRQSERKVGLIVPASGWLYCSETCECSVESNSIHHKELHKCNYLLW